MNQEQLAELLKKHLQSTQNQASDLYIIRLKKTIANLEDGIYQEEDEKLVIDLQSLGFQDLAQQVRRGMYL